MSTPEPLRNNPFRLQRRRSLRSALYSGGHTDRSLPHQGTSHVPSGPGWPPRTYMSNWPEEYVPNIGPGSTSANDYQLYDNDAFHLGQNRTTEEFHLAARELTGADAFGRSVQYADSLMTEEYLQQQLEALREENGEPLPMPFDTNEQASRILNAHRQREGFNMDRNLQEDSVEIRMAIEHARAESLAGEPVPMDNSISDESIDAFPSLPEVTEALGQLSEVLPPDHPDLINLRWAAHEWFGLPVSRSQGDDYGANPESPNLASDDPYMGTPYAEAQEAFEPQDITQMDQESIEQTIDQATEPEMVSETMAEQPDAFAPTEDAHDQQFVQGLEGVVQEAMSEHDPFEQQQQMYDEQMMMLTDPFMMPDPFGPGPGM